MDIPNHILRYPTKNARKSLSSRLSIFFDESSQDWEWEVADSTRIDEFFYLYKSGELTEDELFSLMEIILQSFEDFSQDLLQSDAWAECLYLLKKNIYIHIYSIYYWSMVSENKSDNCFSITPFMRNILRESEDILKKV